eukprot:gene5897-9032_t
MSRSWHLHGSKDGETWIILKIHSKDSSFDDKLEAAQDVSPPLSADQPYRHFRIVLMDNGSSEGNNVLALASFDLYGELCYQHEPKVRPFEPGALNGLEHYSAGIDLSLMCIVQRYWKVIREPLPGRLRFSPVIASQRKL